MSSSPVRRTPSGLTRVTRALGVAVRSVPFGLWFLGQMVAANWQVSRDLLTPGLSTTPGVAAVPLRCRTRAELTLLSNLITLTPGTVTIEVDRHGHVLYVLDIYAPARPDDLRAQVHATETRMLRMIRGTEPPAPPTGAVWRWSGRAGATSPVADGGAR
ncbi:cation transporter [Actinotalea ferrariae CF5-4]|uniref:Cation transporter n=1 Tax=Actinotalea ferrariae CF5-4 TaxID=948458 RepID=A0A021VX28_9CELL|nr:Na+/H+ antiporter subunit E [Actinotalea ferrariae]EYR63632.1 cation transporter [Actinotalea ferrariae CF5-4]